MKQILNKSRSGGYTMKKMLTKGITILTVVMLAINGVVFSAEYRESSLFFKEPSTMENIIERDLNVSDKEIRDLPNNDVLEAMYIEKLLYGNGISTYKDYGLTALEGVYLEFYKAYREKIENIAAGKDTSSKFEYEWETPFTDKDAMYEVAETVLDYLIVDLPEDFYWRGSKYSLGTYSFTENVTKYYVKITFDIAVSADYMGASEYEVDTQKMDRARNAVANAQALVDKYSGMSEKERILGYKDEICSRVTYNYAAVDISNKSSYGDPWQLVYVFDNDDTTNVVCEGYSKAFQYMCDLGDIECYTVRGTTTENHMWNIVMWCGIPYLADITACDQDHLADEVIQKLTLPILNPAVSSSGTGCVFKLGENNIVTYTYKDTTKEMYPESILAVTTDSTEPVEAKLSLSPEQTEIKKGEIAEIGILLEQAQPSDGEISISSSSDKIASVSLSDEKILVEGKSKGEATVTCTFTPFRGKTVSAESVISVISDEPVSGGNDEISEDGKTVIIPDGTESINITKILDEFPAAETIQIPQSVNDIIVFLPYFAYPSNPVLTNIYVDPKNETYCSDNGIVYSKDKKTLVYYPAGRTDETFAVSDGVEILDYDSFNSCHYIKNITIPDSVVTINLGAFRNCDSLADITIPKSVTKIESSAFYDCGSLLEIKIPDSVTFVGQYLFYDCTSLEKVKLGSGISTLSNNMFENCKSLKNVILPDLLNSIGSQAFCHCFSLENISLPDSLEKIGEMAFYECSMIKSIIIPDNVQTIGYDAFRGCVSLKSINIPDGVKYVNFDTCTALESLYIPSSVEKLTLYDCLSLKTIEAAPENPKYCSVDGVMFNKDKTVLLYYPAGKEVDSYTIPSGVTKISTPLSKNSEFSYSFKYCRLKSITIPKSVEYIYAYAFQACKALEEVYYDGTMAEWNNIQISKFNYDLLSAVIHCIDGDINSTVKSVSGFKYSENEDGTIFIEGYTGGKHNIFVPSMIEGKLVTKIDDCAFYGCDFLTSIEIPNSITMIGSEAFRGCKSLTAVVIPKSVERISNKVFWDCDSLTDILFMNAKISLAYDVLPRNCSYVTIYGETGSTIESYSKNYSIAFKPVNEFPIQISGVCGEDVRWHLTKDGVLTVYGSGDMTDYGLCGAPWYDDNIMPLIKKAIVKDGVTSIGQLAFYNCDSIESVDIADSVTTIKQGAFSLCDSLADIKLSLNTISIANAVFGDCKALEKIKIPESVNYIGEGAFYECINLAEVELPSEMEFIGESAFFLCQSLKAIAIPNGITTINENTFSMCKNIENIKIPISVKFIGFDAFAGCPCLIDVYYDGSAEDWNQIAIAFGNNHIERANIHFSSVMPPITIIGDIDNDGVVTTNDAFFAIKASFNSEQLSEEQFAIADVDGDGELTTNDALLIIKSSFENN